MKVAHCIWILLPFLCIGCLKDEEIKLKTKEYTPAPLDDGWEIESFSAENVDLTILNEVMDEVYAENDYPFARSLVIVRKGRLLAEAYPKNLQDRDKPHQIWSATKSVVSLLIGIAIDKKQVGGVKDSVFTYLPEYKSFALGEKGFITIEDCLTMRSGIDYNNDNREEEEILAQIPDDLTKYMLERPLKTKPGSQSVYKNSDPQLLVKVIENASQTDLVDFAKATLFTSLEINQFYWSRHKDNTPYGGFGLWLTPRSLAKLGHLLLNKGKWKQNQVVSEQWINQATYPQTALSGYSYGYYFWIDEDNQRYWCWGHGGQYIYIVPEKEVVIVFTSDQFADEGGTTIHEITSLVNKIVSGIK